MTISKSVRDDEIEEKVRKKAKADVQYSGKMDFNGQIEYIQ